MPSYKELRIPTDWMLDSGIASKVVSLSVMLMQRPACINVNYIVKFGWNCFFFACR